MISYGDASRVRQDETREDVAVSNGLQVPGSEGFALANKEGLQALLLLGHRFPSTVAREYLSISRSIGGVPTPYTPMLVEGVRLLKKSLSHRSMVSKQVQNTRKPGQNPTKPGLKAPERRSEEGTKEFSNTLRCSR